MNDSSQSDANVASATNKTTQGEKAIDNPDGRMFIYPAEFDAQNEQEYIKFQLWCHEDDREGSWPPVENAHMKDKSSRNQKDCESEDESDDESDDETDNDYNWLPEQFQVASVPLPTEATLSRPIAYLLFRSEDPELQAERMINAVVKGMSLAKKTAKLSPLQEAVMKTIEENRKITHLELLREKTSFLLRVSVLQSSLPIFRDIRVPSNMNLRMLQGRVLCPIFDWDAKAMPQKYLFYLPHTCYPSQRRPLSPFKDIVFTRPFQGDSLDFVTHSSEAFEAEVIDDSDVCLADFLQEIGHTLYYQHNLTIPITFQLKVLQLNQDKSVELIGGEGISPPESGLALEGPFDQEIIGIDAFNLAIKWLQSSTIHKSYKDKGKRLLEISEDTDTFDPNRFDLPAARKMLQRSLRHPNARTHIPVEAKHMSSMLMFGGLKPGMHFPVVKSLGMCKTCLKENVKLLTCGRCKSVCYCSRDCQKKDWKTHKAVCASY